MVNKFAFTPVKRSHLIQGSGVGSLVRLRTGITALILDLQAWQDSIPTGKAVGFNKDAEREKRLMKHRRRDPELESATGAPFFVEPPSGPSDDVSMRDDWILPAVRFPRWTACANQLCGRIRFADPDNQYELRGKREGCTCGSDNTRFRRPLQQVPIMLVCAQGHIDEIDWVTAAHNYGSVCSNPDVRVRFGASVKRPLVDCEACKSKHLTTHDYSIPCTGARPWTEQHNEVCAETMHVVERTNVSVYFPSVKSSIYIPDKNADNEILTAWLSTLDLTLILDNPSDANGLARLHKRAIQQGFGSDVTVEVLSAHLARLMNDSDAEADTWDQFAARARELETLTDSSAVPAAQSRLLRFHTPADTHLARFCQPGGIFSSVVAIDRLTETRILDGFGRWVPVAEMTKAKSHKLMWGDRPIPRNKRWLPGFRVTGEGILFVISDDALNAWESRLRQPIRRLPGTEPTRLSLAGTAAHTFAHGVMQVLSDRCGYPLPGIRDRIYDLPDGQVAFLVYTADGDSFGTLGGLVEHAEGPKLSSLLDDTWESLQWCTQDPVCNASKADGELRTPGACHHCVLVPETSCERFNNDLDRAYLIGSQDRLITGLL